MKNYEIMKKLLKEIKEFLWLINPVDMPVTYFTVILFIFFIIFLIKKCIG